MTWVALALIIIMSVACPGWGNDGESIPDSELAALYELYNATNGEHWTWKNTTEYGALWNFHNITANPCADRWQGLNCTTSTPYHITNISLVSYNLNGTIPSSMEAFVNLTALDLSANAIYGSIPSTIGRLEYLKLLCFDYNYLTGSIPDSLGDLQRLNVLKLSANMYNSTIPSSLGNLQELTNLEIYGGFLTGTIPSTIGQLCNLQYLSLQGNFLEGTFPSEFTCMTQLLMANFYSNWLSGTLPDTIGAWKNMTVLYCGENFLTGPIPASIGNFTQVNTWNLNANHLSGGIPASLGLMRSLQYFDFEVNALTGQFPDSIGNCSQLWYINSQNNRLSGTLPSSIGDLPLLQQILMGNNSLTGTLPSSYGKLSNLLLFIVGISFIHGPIPASYGSLAVMEYLDFSRNLLSGSIPDTIGGLASAKVLYLFNNSLSGTIPGSVGNLRLIQELQANNNKLQGSIPTTIQHLRALSALLLYSNRLSGTLERVFNASSQVALTAVQLSGNQLTGALPPELFRLPQILTIAVVSNCFTGDLPDNICAALLLNTLALDGLRSASNCQSKIIPGVSDAYRVADPWNGPMRECLFVMPNLTTLHLSGNGFTGTLSDSLRVSEKLLDLSLSHNVLTGSIPRSIQSRAWNNLDLSYNRFSGTLERSFGQPVAGGNASYGAGTTVSLENNRLSGRIPHSIRTSQGNVTVLSSNLFSCRVDRSDLPKQDSDVANYQCGSAPFNAPFFIWLGLLVALVTYFAAVKVGVCRGAERVMEVLRQMQAWASVMDIHGNDKALDLSQRLLNYQVVSDVFHRLCVVSLRCAGLILCVLAPLYIGLSSAYGTVTYQSAYVASAGFLSGPVPVGLIMTALVVLMAVMVRSFVRLLSINQSEGASQDRAVSVATQDRPARERFAIYTAFMVINLTVVIGVNAAYVYVALYQSGTLLLFVQVLMSFFKLFWNKYCGSYLVMSITSYISGFEALAVRQYSKEFLSVQLIVTLFNSVGVPCLVVALISPNCFYNAFVAAANVDASYTFSDCTTGFNAGTDSCTFVSTPGTTSYSPPFTYSYQCSASFITYYAPAFLYLCVAASVLVPCTRLAAFTLRKRAVAGTSWHRWLSRCLPHLWKATPAADDAGTREADPWKPLFEANAIVISLLTYLGIMLTFGAVFPPLALTLLVTIGVTVLMARVAVGRWVSLCIQNGSNGRLAVIEIESRKVRDPAILANALWILLNFSCCFYTLFLFDMLGDAVGFAGAYWVLIVTPLLPSLLYAARAIRLRWGPPGPSDRAEQADTQDKTDIELAEQQKWPSGGAGRAEHFAGTINAMHITQAPERE